MLSTTTWFTPEYIELDITYCNVGEIELSPKRKPFVSLLLETCLCT